MKSTLIMFVWLSAFLAISARAAPTATPAPVVAGPVSFFTEDGISLAGRVFGQGPNWVILAHMPVTHDQKSWGEFAELVGKEDMTALTFDFRGHGSSTGSRDLPRLDRDTRAAVRFAQDKGAKGILLAGASLGGTSVLKVASAAEVAGVIAVAAPHRDRDSVSQTQKSPRSKRRNCSSLACSTVAQSACRARETG